MAHDFEVQQKQTIVSILAPIQQNTMVSPSLHIMLLGRLALVGLGISEGDEVMLAMLLDLGAFGRISKVWVVIVVGRVLRPSSVHLERGMY